MPAEAATSRRVAAVLDVVAVVVLVVLPIVAWQREGVVPAAGQPAWIFESDQYLYGPDAAAWAQNALALDQGRLADLDAHRLPTWTMLTVGVMRLTGWDVALSGHLVNRLLHVLLGPVLYALGRGLGLRGLAFAAAGLVVIQPALLAAACRFGVDPTVTFLVPLLLLTAWQGGRTWALAPLGGAVAALTMVSHLTALGFPLCGLCLCAASAPRSWWRGPLSVLLYAGAGYLTFRAVFSVFPMLAGDFFVNSLAEGVAPTHGAGDQDGSRDAALAMVQANAPQALDRALRLITTTFRPAFLPWSASVALVWLGFVGPQAWATAEPGEGWSARVGRVLRSAVQGFAVASAMAPLLAFAAAGSPERYSDNLLPAAALVMATGAATVVSALGGLLAWRPSWAWARPGVEVVLSGALAVAWVASEWQEPHQRAPILAPGEERAALPVGRALAEHFPPGGGGVSAMREVLPYAGLTYCPLTVCPTRADEMSYRTCIKIMRKECPGEGDIPLVVMEGLTLEQRSEARASFEAWVGERLAPVATVGTSRIYAIPREGEL